MHEQESEHGIRSEKRQNRDAKSARKVRKVVFNVKGRQLLTRYTAHTFKINSGRELSQALEENRVLRIEIEELEQDRDTLIAALEEQHEEMTKAKQIADQAKTDYEDVQKNEDILKDDLKDARAKLLAAEDERHELEKVQASHETIVQRCKKNTSWKTVRSRKL